MAAVSQVLKRHVTITGLTEILFDRYPGDNKTVLSDPAQKMYLGPNREICLPALNVLSFMSAQNTESAPKVCLDKRIYKSIASALLASLRITPTLIPFLRDRKPIIFGGWNENMEDPSNGLRVVHHVARLEKGIPNPKERPMLPLPWSLEFDLTVFPHPELTEEMIEGLFIDGGQRLGLGTYRKAFGKFAFEWK